MVEQNKEGFDVELLDTDVGEPQGEKPKPESQVTPIMVPLAELQKIRAEKRSLKEQNAALSKMLSAQTAAQSHDKYADEDLVTHGDLKAMQALEKNTSLPAIPAATPTENYFKVGDEEARELEAELKKFVPDYDKVIAAGGSYLANNPNMLSAIRYADNPPAMAYELSKAFLATGQQGGAMSETNPTENQEKVERIQFNEQLPRNVKRSSGGGRNILQFSAAEIAALPQAEFNEIWGNMTPAAQERLKRSIQVGKPVGNFPTDIRGS